MPDFHVVSSYVPSGDQPEAIDALADGLERGIPEQTLLGVTGSGKTYTMAKVIEQRASSPTLVHRAQQDARGPALLGVPASFSRITPWNTLSPTTTTTSPRPIYPQRTPTLRRTAP